MYFTVYYKPFEIPLPDVVKKTREYAMDPHSTLTAVFTKNFQSNSDHLGNFHRLKEPALSHGLEKMVKYEKDLKQILSNISEEVDSHSEIRYYS